MAAGDWEAAGGCAPIVSGQCWQIVGFGWRTDGAAVVDGVDAADAETK